MRAREKRKSLTPWLVAAGAAGVLAIVLTRPKVRGQLTKLIDALDPVLLKRYMELRPKIRAAAQAAGIPPEVLAGTLRVESRYNNAGRREQPYCDAAGVTCTCTGKHPDVGLAQISVDSARVVGYTGDAKGLCDVDTNLKYSALYLKRLADLLAKPESRAPGQDLWTAVRIAYNVGRGGYQSGNFGSRQLTYAARAVAVQEYLRQKGLAGLAFALST